MTESVYSAIVCGLGAMSLSHIALMAVRRITAFRLKLRTTELALAEAARRITYFEDRSKIFSEDNERVMVVNKNLHIELSGVKAERQEYQKQRDLYKNQRDEARSLVEKERDRALLLSNTLHAANKTIDRLNKLK